ncbi:hypothetical protein GMDG_00740 [Pseudogymnoascus destructans 20631-21]|uniref:Alcohol dehydrogenase-like N-terminal domain-containing protein n=1 Tax=Pseudogymnoascus destructans (strain ATCC MYA-4855 / 20631-21) TaxID=658429 RepID=L8GA72_PSED2|nr:hypothetical protein GMDG_00740 [Pseudogymnoascus destructans 20631-21]
MLWDEKVPKLRVVEPRDIVLRVTGSTICGFDLHLLHGTIVELQKDDIMGHEFCGIVESVGPQVKNVKPGQRVVASFQIACEECGPCKKKQSSQLASLGTLISRAAFQADKAEYVRVPFGDVNLLKLPDRVPDEKGHHLSDIICTSWNAVVDTGVEKGDVVAIWGAGPIGQMAADFSLHNGAARVILIDNYWRLI